MTKRDDWGFDRGAHLAGIPIDKSKNLPRDTAVWINIGGQKRIITDNPGALWIRLYAATARREARAHLRRIVAETEARLFGAAA